MKLIRLSLLAAALAGSTLIATAGPGPQYWARPATPKPAAKTTVPAAQATAAQTPACTTCACVKQG